MMSNLIEIIPGPSTSKVSREAAEKQLTAHPRFPKNATYALTEVDGRWVAAITKEAAPAFFDGGEGEEAPAGPPSDGPEAPEAEEPKDEGAPDLDGDEDKPEKKDHKEKDGKGGELDEIKELLTVLVTALGLAPKPEDSMVPGLDGPQGPPGADGPPVGPGPGGDGKNHTVHERSLKPGESPPGTTPVGAPSFASVQDDHPWKNVIGSARSFTVENEIGPDETLSSISAELKALANGTGYEVKQLLEDRSPEGKRIAKALISR